MQIRLVEEHLLFEAAKIHSISWKESHKAFCSEKFVAKHTIEYQMEYLKEEIQKGKALYILYDTIPVGIVSIHQNCIENLYVLPEEQAKGYGSILLEFAEEKCNEQAKLTVLSQNTKAIHLYEKNGFRRTGKEMKRSNLMFEIEMKKEL